MTITTHPVTEDTFDDYFYDLMRGQYPVHGSTFEGYSESYYSDSKGIPSVGVGTALITGGPGSYAVRSDLTTIFSGVHSFSPSEMSTLSTIASQLNAGNVSGAQATLTIEFAING